MKNNIFVIGIFFSLLFSACTAQDDLLQIETGQGTTEVTVEIVDTMEQRMQGLMGREKLEEGHGMLFVYEEGLIPIMWMKNMLIPLDMLFISPDMEVVHIAENAPPCHEEDDADCPRYGDVTKVVSYVLELPAAYVEKNGVEIGDKIILPLVLQSS